MVTLYSLDTLSKIRSTSETLGLGPQSNSQHLTSKKSLRTQYLELCKKNENQDNLSLSSEIQSWLKSLTPYERTLVITHENTLICTFIWQMFRKKLTDGEVDFFLNKYTFKYFDIDAFDINFRTEKKSLMAQSISNVAFQVEKSFEKSIRLTDSHEYLDTLTLEAEILTDGEKFCQILKVISEGKAFDSPCNVSWDNSHKLWLWDYPAWFCRAKHFSLSAWAAACIEKSIWAGFWESKGQAPISHKSPIKNYSCKDKNDINKSSHIFSSLNSYFISLDAVEKGAIVGNLDEVNEDCLIIKSYLANAKTNCVNVTNIPKSTTLYPSLRLCFPFYPYPLMSFYTYKEKMNIKFYQSHKSASLVLTKLQSSEKFIEFLMYSPLERSVTLLDFVLRRILYRIFNAYTEKNAMELILGTVLDSKDQKQADQKKSKKKKIKKPKAKKELVCEKVKITDFVQEIIGKLISEALKRSETARAAQESIKNAKDFQEVCSQKARKQRNQPKQKSKPPSKPWKHCRKPLKSQPPLKLQPNKAPSLTPTPALSPSESLHKDILHFTETVSTKLQTKIQTINKILEKISTIVMITFQDVRVELFGSYASGLAIEASDVDIVVVGLHISERADLEMACDYLSGILSTYPFISKIQPIHTARIPVIKLEISTLPIVGTQGVVMFDITFDDSCVEGCATHLGLSTLYLTKELQRLYPPLQYLTLVLKKFLYQHDLNSAYKGGLSSYSLVLWVAALLNSMVNVSDNLGELLLEFLRFFGKEFDATKMGVNIINGGSFFVLEQQAFENAVTVDPVNPKLNNTRMSYNIAKVLEAFGSAYDALIEGMNSGKQKNLLKSILKRKKKFEGKTL